MAKYRISGVWKNADNVITHYAFHAVGENGTTRAVKRSKSEAIVLLEAPGNSAVTWMWNYKTCTWTVGETVEVVNGAYGKFLRSNPDDRTTDNLAHLIDYDWISG